MYQAIREALASKPTLLPIQNKIITAKNIDYYQSLFCYTEKHKQIYNSTGSLAGIEDTTGNRLFFDFDDKANLEAARQDALALCLKLDNKFSISEANIQPYFSSNKGFHVEVCLDKFITQAEFKAAVYNLALGYKTFDTVVNDANRVIRVNNTINPTSGLYKIPLTLAELEEMPVNDIRALAKSPRPLPLANAPITLPEALYAVTEQPKTVAIVETIDDIDFTKKVKGWSNCKWALTQGFGVASGKRHDKLLCIIATAKALNNTKELAYYYAKSADEQGVERNGGDKHDKKKLWELVESVYNDKWKGGTFSCRDGKSLWLTEVCGSLGSHKCKKEEEGEIKVQRFADLKDDFKEYVKNIDKNTIRTGLPTLDEAVFLSTGANVCVIGAAGSGKTSVGLEILNNTSKAGVRSVVASLDMAKNRIFEKILYRLSGLPRNELYKIFQEDREAKLMEQLEQEFGNVNFFKKACPSVQDIKDYIIKCNEDGGQKVKLVVLDYFERVVSEFSEDTASSKKIAGELQDLVDELGVCLITLVQPNKNSLAGGPDQPILSYTAIKGSSFVYQSMRIILSVFRPFYSPKDFSNDKYMKMSVLKNDLGELSEMSFGWEGKRGFITELSEEQKFELEEALKAKAPQKEDLF